MIGIYFKNGGRVAEATQSGARVLIVTPVTWGHREDPTAQALRRSA